MDEQGNISNVVNDIKEIEKAGDKMSHQIERFSVKTEEFLKNIVINLVDYPDDVCVTAVEGEQTTVFELRVNESDLGKVIGKQGRIVSAIRRILWGISSKHDRKAVLEVME